MGQRPPVTGRPITAPPLQQGTSTAPRQCIIFASQPPFITYEFVVEKTVLYLQWQHRMTPPLQTFMTPEQPFIVLVEVEGHNGLHPITLYLSSAPYRTRRNDTPGYMPYMNVIRQIPEISLSIGNHALNLGDITLSNTENRLTSFWKEYDFAGRRITVLIGEPNQAKANFYTLFSGTVNDKGLQLSGAHDAKIGFYDHAKLLDVPMNDGVIVYIGKDGEPREVTIPVCYGICFNVSLVYIGRSNDSYKRQQFQFNDGPSQAIVVRDRGYLLKEGLNYSVDLEKSIVTMLIPPNGELTADVRGWEQDGYLLEKTGDILWHMITHRTQIPRGYLDRDSFLALNALVPYARDWFVKDGGNVLNAITALLDGVGGYLYANRNGVLAVGQKGQNRLNPTAQLRPRDTQHTGMKFVSQLPPYKALLLTYQHNYSEQDKSSLAQSLEEALEPDELEQYTKPYLTVKVTNTDPVFTAKFLQAINLAKSKKNDNATVTHIAHYADAQQEGERKIALRSRLAKKFEFRGFEVIYALTIGQGIQVFDWEPVLEDGQVGEVQDLKLNVLKHRATVEVLFYD